MKRRDFFRRSAISLGNFVILNNSQSARTAQANEKIQTAHIGVGGRGRQLLSSFCRLAIPVAFCDVNQSRAKQMFERFPNLPRFEDFREMLAAMESQIDGVVIAIPDHTHAVATAAAISADKHVYTEKPLTRTVSESRRLRELASQHNVATSMGNQGTSSPQFRRALELIREGAVGEIHSVHIWNNQGGPEWSTVPEGTEPEPDYLNWDLWLGPAASRPFHHRWLTWHGWRDFGTGKLGNWASHTANLAFMALRVDSLWRADPAAKPVLKVRAEASSRNPLSFPRWEYVRWDVPQRGELPPVSFHWYNGSSRPGTREELEAELGRGLDWGDKGPKRWTDWAGCLIVGSEGKIYANSHNATFEMLPRATFRNIQQREPEQLEKSAGHENDWLNACRGGSPAWANFEYAGPLTEFNLLGNVATQVEGELQYDPINAEIINSPQANLLLRSDYRDGWTL